jgi:hypothetical protein
MRSAIASRVLKTSSSPCWKPGLRRTANMYSDPKKPPKMQYYYKQQRLQFLLLSSVCFGEMSVYLKESGLLQMYKSRNHSSSCRLLLPSFRTPFQLFLCGWFYCWPVTPSCTSRSCVLILQASNQPKFGKYKKSCNYVNAELTSWLC